MMMSDGKKKASMIIASMGSPMEEKPTEDGAEQDSSAGYDAAASEIMQAVSSKDPAALKEALKSFVSMCMDESEPDESESAQD